MTSYDVNVLETLGEHAGAALEQIQFYKVLQFSSLIDIQQAYIILLLYTSGLRRNFLEVRK